MSDAKRTLLYYNPGCSKSRAALEILHDHGIEPQLIDYLKIPPSPEDLEQLLDMLGMQPRDLMRKHEKEYNEAGLDDPSLSREALIDAFRQYPRLLERPILVIGERAVIGRPPEKILEFIP